MLEAFAKDGVPQGKVVRLGASLPEGAGDRDKEKVVGGSSSHAKRLKTWRRLGL